MLACAACASKNLHVAARMYVSGCRSAVCLPQPCSCVVCPAAACPALAVRTYDAAPCICAAARVLSRVVTMRVGLCDKDASLREMDVVLVDLVTCVHMYRAPSECRVLEKLVTSSFAVYDTVVRLCHHVMS